MKDVKKNIKYYVDAYDDVVIITKGTAEDTVNIFRCEEPIITYVCENMDDATCIAKVILDGHMGAVRDKLDIRIGVKYVERDFPSINMEGYCGRGE